MEKVRVWNENLTDEEAANFLGNHQTIRPPGILKNWTTQASLGDFSLRHTLRC
jgi:hypothetical protein